jgi:ABC-type histidine transport system ATPase subunit
MVKSLEKCNVTQLLFIWKGVLAENGSPDDILDNRNSVFVKKYLPIYQDKIR